MKHEKDSQPVPAYAIGGFVRETGLALVHEGEYIVPAAGSEASIEPVARVASGSVNYYFPVEIELVGAIPEQERAALETRIWSQLTDALDRGV